MRFAAGFRNSLVRFACLQVSGTGCGRKRMGEFGWPGKRPCAGELWVAAERKIGVERKKVPKAKGTF